MKIGSMLTLALLTCAAPAAAQQLDQAWQPNYRQRNAYQEPKIYNSYQPPNAQQDDQNACMNDAMTVCSQFIPDRSRVAGCLISNRARISAPCRAQLAHWHN